MPEQRRFQLENSFSVGNTIGVTFEVAGVEKINDSVNYYVVEHKDKYESRYKKEGQMIGDYYILGRMSSTPRNSIQIPFSEQVLANLTEIQEVFKKAANFLLGLLTREDLVAVLNSSDGLKMLK